MSQGQGVTVLRPPMAWGHPREDPGVPVLRIWSLKTRNGAQLECVHMEGSREHDRGLSMGWLHLPTILNSEGRMGRGRGGPEATFPAHSEEVREGPSLASESQAAQS